jgi:uncharacterized cupredoxin-like copper-binding protein
MAGADRGERRRRETEARRAAHRPSAIAAKKRRRTLIAAGIAGVVLVVLAVVVVLALTGGDDGEPAVVEPSSAITIEGDEYSFVPDPALGLSGEIDLTLANVGKIGHELIILEPGVRIAAASEFDESTEVGRIDSIAEGTEASTSVDLDVGTYQVVCLIGGHLESGMSADLIVS